jgi:hypothetical protein
MADFNLIPASYQQRLARQRTLRIASAGAVVVVTAGLAVYLLLAQWVGQVRDEVAVLEKQQAISARQRDAIAALNADQRELEQQWRLLESLRSGMPAKALMEKVHGALSGKDVWFIDWRLRRAGIVTRKEPAANQPGYFVIVKQQGNPEDWRSGTHMTIKGQATDHSRLSEFAQRLLSEPDIQDVRVQRTSQSFGRNRQPVAVDFELAIVFHTDSEHS